MKKTVTAHCNRKWTISEIIKSTEAAMHDTAIFKGDVLNVFVKCGINPFLYNQFIQEAWGLNHIRDNSSVATPAIINVIGADSAALLIMETIDVKTCVNKKDWAILGAGLAELHHST